MNHNYDIIISKAVIDGVTSITFAAAMGWGCCLPLCPFWFTRGA